MTAEERLAVIEAHIEALSGQQGGSWDTADPRRAFVAGAQWWEYSRPGGGTMWSSDRDLAANEASRRVEASSPGDTRYRECAECGALTARIGHACYRSDSE